MKLNKNQKQILKHINNGDIYDLYSYIKYNNLGKTIQYNKQEIVDLFNQDSICKEYYYPTNLVPKAVNVLTFDTYNHKLNAREIDKNKYTHFNLSLNFCCGIQEVPISDKNYKINFYDGVYIAKSFNTIIDFLSLWQYLKSEMFILEVPAKISSEIIGLFFEEKTTESSYPHNGIDYSTFSYSDENYIKDYYSFSNEHYAICKDFLSNRIYPTPQLNLYIQKKFRTSEECMQRSALLAAWLAILVTIILTLIPYIYSRFDKNDSANTQINSIIENTESTLSDDLPTSIN